MEIKVVYLIFSTNSNSKNLILELENCMSDIYQSDKEEKIDLDERISMQFLIVIVVFIIGKLGCNCIQSFVNGEIKMENSY